MQKSELFTDIIKRIKDIKHLHSDAQVAKLLNMTRNNLYGYKKRKNLPHEALQSFCSAEGIKIDYLMNGILPVYENELNVVAETHAPYSPAFTEDLNQQNLRRITDTPPAKISELIHKTAAVLESNTIYGLTLKNGIESLHRAMITEKELKLANKRIDDMEEQILEIKKRLPAVGA